MSISPKAIPLNIDTNIFTQQPSPVVKPTGSPEGSSPGAGSGYEVITTYDQRGFPVTQTVAMAQVTGQRHFDDQGFLITTAAAGAGQTQAAQKAEDSATPTSGGVSVTTHKAAAAALRIFDKFALILAAFVGIALLI